MHALIVHCHPEPQSFNAALTARARSTLESLGATVEISDIHGEGFDPVEGPGHYADRADSNSFAPLAEQRNAYEKNSLPADVAREIARLERADLVILQFPLWWHGPPAMLKGWLDRVFVNGGLYTSRMRYDAGYFRGRSAICSVTSGAPAAAFGPGARGGDIAMMMWPVEYSLHYLGFTVYPRFLSSGVQGHGYSYRGAQDLERHLHATIARWGDRLSGLHAETPLRYPTWADWDAEGRALQSEHRDVGGLAA